MPEVKGFMKVAILLGVMLYAGFASAVEAAPYVGLEADRYSITLKSGSSQLYPQSAAGEDLHFGERFGVFAGEIGVGTSTYKGDGVSDNLHLTRATFDGFYYLPVYEGLNFLVTAGGAKTNYGISTYERKTYIDNNVSKITSADQPVLGGSEFDWRGGAGFSFGLEEFELRVLGRYQPLSIAGQAQNAYSVQLGVNFYF
jgi:hypothetical protein